MGEIKIDEIISRIEKEVIIIIVQSVYKWRLYNRKHKKDNPSFNINSKVTRI